MNGAYNYEVPARKLGPVMPPEGDDHHWIIAAMFSVSQATVERMVAEKEAGLTVVDPVALDHENLLTVQGPGCMKCEQQLTPTTVGTKCPVIITFVQLETKR